MENNPGIDTLCDWLDERHREIRKAEDEALACVDAGDAETYRQKMRVKAGLLRDLAKDAQAYMAKLSPERREEVEEGLSRFAASAAQSLALDSVFYMSALLYDDDHKKDAPDNLRKYIDYLRNR